MRPLPFALAAGALTLALAAPTAARDVSKAALARAAREAPLKLIDYGEDHCDDRTVEAWLMALVAEQARDVVWKGGTCQIVGPGIDAGSAWCGRAEVELKRPLSKDDQVIVEVFFEKPEGGKPGVPYAFRAAMHTDDGDDTIRFRKAFEDAWRSRFPAPEGAIVDCPT